MALYSSRSHVGVGFGGSVSAWPVGEVQIINERVMAAKQGFP